MITLIHYSDSTITANEIDSYYTEEYIFDLDKGKSLNVAFGITYYDDNQEMMKVPDYGELIARVKSWNANSGLFWKNVTLRPCTDQELGIAENQN